MLITSNTLPPLLLAGVDAGSWGGAELLNWWGDADCKYTNTESGRTSSILFGAGVGSHLLPAGRSSSAVEEGALLALTAVDR